MNNRGLIATFLLASLGLIAGIAYFAYKKNQNIEITVYAPITRPLAEEKKMMNDVSWQFNGEKWISDVAPSGCEDPVILADPIDLSRVESVLYPGQTRGRDYKPHGGFRLTGDNNVEVKAPLDAKLISGSRYIEHGEVQYLLFFINSCGIAYRFDHLLTLSPEMQTAVEKFLPEAKEDDSGTTNIKDNILVRAGDVIATEVGFKKNKNVSVDFGVYDLRINNEASKNPEYVQKYFNSKEQAFYGICWFNNLSLDSQNLIKSLPAADMASGKESDYCK